MDVPETWAPARPVIREPWMRPEIRAGIAELIADLEAAGPEGLDGMRRRFRDLRRADSATAITKLDGPEEVAALATQLTANPHGG